MQAVTEQGPARRPVIEVLYVEGCPNYREALALVKRVRAELGIDAELRTTLISEQAVAEQARFPGSPTVRVDGHDVEPGSEPPAEYTLACRLYRLEHRFAGQPDERWVREALLRQPAAADGHRHAANRGRMPLHAADDTSRERCDRPAACGSGVEVDDRRSGRDAAHVRHHGCLR
jgi:hypothetical protein